MRPAEYRIQNTESGRPPHPSVPPTAQFLPSFQNPESNIHSCAISAPMHMHHMHMSPAEYRMQNTECAPDRPTCSFHAFWGILYAAAEYRMQGVECKDTGKRRLQQNPRFLRIQNPGLQFLFPHLQPLLTHLLGASPSRPGPFNTGLHSTGSRTGTHWAMFL